MSYFIKFPAIVFLLFVSATLHSQTVQDSNTHRIAIYNTVKLYTDYLGNQSGLYNGRRYNDYRHTINSGIPFLDTTVFRQGWVIYNGVLYEKVPLLFDILKNKIVSAIENSNYMFELINSRLTAFGIAHRRFIWLNADYTYGKAPSGYYEILFEGKENIFYKRYKKTIREDLSQSKVLNNILDDYIYYIKTPDGFFELTKRKRFLKIFSDHRKEVSTYLRKTKFDYRQKQDAEITKLAIYYEKLSTKNH